MRALWLCLLLLSASAKRKKRKTKKQARRDLVGEFEKVLRGASVDSHVTYEDFRGQEKTMPVRKMAETLADQNLNPPFDKDQDGRLRSKVNEGSGSIDELEGDVKRHAHLARAAHAKLKALGYNVGRLTGARSWAPDRNSTGTGEGVDARDPNAVAASDAKKRGRLCETVRLLLKTRDLKNSSLKGAVAVRLSEYYGVAVLRAAWEVEDGRRVRELKVPPDAKKQLHYLVLRRFAFELAGRLRLNRWPRYLVLAVPTVAALAVTRSPTRGVA